MGKGARNRLARKLRLLRVMREWSQEDLASASGLHRTHISLIERSACSITLDKLEQLANSFGISLPELLDGKLSDTREPVEGGKRLLATLAKSGRRKRSGRAC